MHLVQQSTDDFLYDPRWRGMNKMYYEGHKKRNNHDAGHGELDDMGYTWVDDMHWENEPWRMRLQKVGQCCFPGEKTEWQSSGKYGGQELVSVQMQGRMVRGGIRPINVGDIMIQYHALSVES